MCFPSTKVIRKVTHNVVLAFGRLQVDKFYDTLQGMEPTNVKTVQQNLFTPNGEQPRSTRIVVAYPRPALSATRRTSHAPISFGQQAQVFQGPTSCRSKKKCSTEVHGGGGLEPAKLTRDPASTRPKPCVSLKNAPRILPVRRSLLAFIGRKQTVVREQFSPQKPPGMRL